MRKILENETVKNLLADLEKRVENNILEPSNFEFLKKLLNKAEDEDEAISICKLGTTYNKTGIIFEKKFEKPSDSLKYFVRSDDDCFGEHNGVVHKLIVGDNYDGLKNLLVEYRNKIDVIYIDPPYGVNSMGEFADTNYENQISRDNLLSMLYPRLLLAKQLLAEDGIIYCSIDDKNHAYVKCLFDDIFGEKNFVESFVFVKNSGGSLTNFTLSRHEYVLFYAKNKMECLRTNERVFKIEKPGYKEVIALVDKLKKEGKTIEDAESKLKEFYKSNKDFKGIKNYTNIDETWEIYRTQPITAPNNNFYNVIHPITKKPVKTPVRGWSWSEETMLENISKGKVIFGVDETKVPNQKLLLKDVQYENKRSTFQTDQAEGNKALKSILGEKQVFDNPKPISLLKYLMQNIKEDAIVLDFFAGSGTTTEAIMELNRERGTQISTILIQLDEKITPTSQTSKNAIELLEGLGLPKVIPSLTIERLRRIITGKTYKGLKDFKWLEKNKPYKNDSLEVCKFDEVSIFGTDIFEKIDETLYGQEKFINIKDKIDWVTNKFEKIARRLEEDVTGN